MPDLFHEQRLGGLVAGVDEVGRGPLAGPVVAAAVILDFRRVPKALRGINDSKQLDAAAREACAMALRNHARIGVGAASVAEIDSVNILQATFLAMARAVAALGIRPDTVLVDGNRPPRLPGLRVETLIGGDALSVSVAAASIVAKVARDKAMRRLAVKYDRYGWHTNVGYGTREHLNALEMHGITCHHRRSFAPVRRCLPVDIMLAPPMIEPAWCGRRDSLPTL